MALAFETDEGAASRAALGLIVLQSDESVEAELASAINLPGVALYHSRIPSAPNVTPETLKQMEADLPHSASLLPTARALDVVGYACTSGATIIGPDRVAELVNAHHPTAKVTNPLSAVIAACGALRVSRLGFVTPYVPNVSNAMRDALSASGISTTSLLSFEQEEEATVARISEQSVLAAITEAANDEAVEAVFVSCTNLRAFSVLEEAESIIGKPVISSNLALAWHMLKLAGCPPSPSAPGRLMNSLR
ncbi:MAG: Asp/Glu racemase [Pseudomonadota bacterium]